MSYHTNPDDREQQLTALLGKKVLIDTKHGGIEGILEKFEMPTIRTRFGQWWKIDLQVRVAVLNEKVGIETQNFNVFIRFNTTDVVRIAPGGDNGCIAMVVIR